MVVVVRDSDNGGNGGRDDDSSGSSLIINHKYNCNQGNISSFLLHMPMQQKAALTCHSQLTCWQQAEKSHIHIRSVWEEEFVWYGVGLMLCQLKSKYQQMLTITAAA
uniref:Uncharacterized protein n=1 Tax=Glossina pallidipes TaxID=7398 RepID=A0A1B0AG03_GLOPL